MSNVDAFAHRDGPAEPGPLLAGEPAEGHVDAKEDGYYDGSEEREHVSSAV